MTIHTVQLAEDHLWAHWQGRFSFWNELFIFWFYYGLFFNGKVALTVLFLHKIYTYSLS